MIQTFYIDKTIDNFGNIKNRKKVASKDFKKTVTTLIESDYPSKVVYATLRNLRSKGNASASDLLNGKNGIIETSDLINDTWEKCLTLARYGFISTQDGIVALSGISTTNNDDVVSKDTLIFTDIPTYKEYTDSRNYDKSGMYETIVTVYLAKGINDTLLNLRTYGNKRVNLYTTVETKEGIQECSIFDIGKLAMEYSLHNGTPDVDTLARSNTVYQKTLDIIKASKHSKLDMEVLQKRAIGCTWKQCAEHLNRTIKTVRVAKARLEKAYKQALKECERIPKTDNLPTYGNKGITTTTVFASNYETPYYTVQHENKPLYDVTSALSALEWCQHGYADYMSGIVKKAPTAVAWWNDSNITRKLNESDRMIKEFLNRCGK